MADRVRISDLDFVYVSFKEPNKEKNWADLKSKVPWAKRVDGVVGFDNAHKAAADTAETDFFISVDGDNVIDENFLLETLDWEKTNKKSVAVTGKVAEGVKKEAQEKSQAKSDEEFYLSWTDDDAQVWVDKMFEVAEKFAESPDGARSQWQANKKTIDHLTTNHPKAYESLKEKFTNLSNKLKTKEGNNDE